MPATIAEDVTFPGTVQGPAAGDARTAASVRAQAAPLASRTRWLLARTQELLGLYAPITTVPGQLAGCNVTTGVFTLVGHGLIAADSVRFKLGALGGAMPTNTPADTLFVVVFIDANTFGVALTQGGPQLTGLGGALTGETYVVKITDSLAALWFPTVGGISATNLRTLVSTLASTALATTFNAAVNFTKTVSLLGASGGPTSIALNPPLSILRRQELRIANMRTFAQPSTAVDATAELSANPDFGTVPYVRTKSLAALGTEFFWLAIDIPDGAILSSVVVTTKGFSSANNPVGKASYTIVRYTSGVPETAMSIATADTHTYGGGGTWLTAVANTLVAVNATPTVDRTQFSYALAVTPPYDGGSGSIVAVYDMYVVYSMAALGVQ